MAEISSKYPQYTHDYHLVGSDKTETTLLEEMRQPAWTVFNNIGLPTARRGNEKWKYTDVRPIANKTFVYAPNVSIDRGLELKSLENFTPNSDDWINLVFIDGVYQPRANKKILDSVEVSTLHEALENHEELVKKYLGREADYSEDGFTALNTAFIEDGAFVLASESSEENTVVNLVFLTSGQVSDCVTYPRVLLIAQPGSHLSVIENYVSLCESSSLTNSVTEIYVEENATIKHYRICLEKAHGFHVGVSRVCQEADSTFISASFALGAAIGRNDFHVLLDGEGANCELSGLYLTLNDQHQDNFISIDHAKPNGTSRLFYKGILDGSSKAVFGGNVIVRKNAQKTDAQQTDKNLLLSDSAEIDSKPSLLIYADDVVCGHGATAGHIDEDTLFYMRSRGLDAETASRILIHAFAAEILDKVDLLPLGEFLNNIYDEYIPSATLSFGSVQ
ncbi:MAG: Fe-S cluster assembly protein SufD [Dehalococcoidia bacterium]|nr:Fe-S cluster assembly protein SufD [Dehalococcoidia bacterium]